MATAESVRLSFVLGGAIMILTTTTSGETNIMAASRKLYTAMARTIHYHVEGADPLARQAIDRLVRDMAHDLKQDNMAFNRDKFMTACGLS